MQPKRKPEHWDGLDPWIALGMAVTLQAHRDLVKGAWLARKILGGCDERRRARVISNFRERAAWTAAEFFLTSPICHYFMAHVGDGTLPSHLREDIDNVLKAARVLGIVCEEEEAVS